MIKEQLQGLILPPQENSSGTVLWLALFLFLALFALAFWRWKKTQMTRLFIARQELQALIKTPALNNKAKQMAAIRCSQILSRGFGVKHLDQYHPDNSRKWQFFYQKLNALCYSDKSGIELKPLLKEACSFLSDKQPESR